MAHEFVSGVFYQNGAERKDGRHPAWHGLGRVVDHKMTVPDALVQSGIAEVVTHEVPVFVKTADGEFVAVEDYTAVAHANDDGRVYGIHTDGYKAADYKTACFMPLHDMLVAGGLQSDLVVASTLLRKGRVATMTLEFPDLGITLPDGSPMSVYLNAWTSHDGSYSLTYREAMIRIVCANTLAMSDREAGGAVFRIRHSSKLGEQRDSALALITRLEERTKKHAAQAERLLATKISDSVWGGILDKFVPIPVEDGRSRTMASNKQYALHTIYTQAADQTDIYGTAWGAYNAFAAYTDHVQTYKQSKMSTSGENRFIRTQMTGDTLATKVLADLVAL